MKTAELYDLLHELFGIGPDDEALPWYKARAIEIGKLNRMLKARHCTAEEVAEAARYAKARRTPITQAWQVFQLVPDALKARRLSYEEQRATELRNERAGAIQDALRLHETGWADRLMRVPDAALSAVLKEWSDYVESAHLS